MTAGGSEKIPGAFSIIMQGTDQNGREVSWILTGLPDGVDLSTAVTTGAVITDQEIASWFNRAGASMPAPDQNHLRSLTHNLNILRVTDIERTKLPENKGLAQVKRALQTLDRELPALIDGGRRSQALAANRGTSASRSPEEHAAVERLHVAVVDALPSFHFQGPRKRRQPWHDVADLIASSAAAAWKHAGSRRVGVGKPTSPAILFTAIALERLGAYDPNGCAITPDAIAKALSRRKNDPSNFRGQIVVGQST